jgi:hypothetical protein
LVVFDDDAPQFHVRLAYGTSQRTTTLHSGEFSILHEQNRAAYEAAGLSYNTKFDLKKALDLPYSTEWFSVPAAAPHGQTPKLGILHPSLMRLRNNLFAGRCDGRKCKPATSGLSPARS